MVFVTKIKQQINIGHFISNRGSFWLMRAGLFVFLKEVITFIVFFFNDIPLILKCRGVSRIFFYQGHMPLMPNGSTRLCSNGYVICKLHKTSKNRYFNIFNSNRWSFLLIRNILENRKINNRLSNWYEMNSMYIHF